VLELARDAYRDGLVEDWRDRMDAATACASGLVAGIRGASRPAPTDRRRLRG
jgi:hypothetical protein